MIIETPKDPKFKRIYTKHCKLLKLNGLQPKTVDAYSRAIRRIGRHFDYDLNRSPLISLRTTSPIFLSLTRGVP